MNRTTPFILIGSALLLSGCEFSTKSPFTGKDVTADELAVEIKTEQAKIETEQAQVKRDAEAKLAEVAAASARGKAIFAKAVSKIESDARSQIDVLKAEFDSNAFEAESIQNRIVNDTKSAIQALDDRRIASEAAAKAAIERLEAKQTQFGALLSATQVLAEGFGGPVGGVAAALIGAGGLFFGVKKRRDAEAAREAATRIVDAIDVLKAKRPEIAAVFKAEASTLAQWLGPKAVDFVNRVQNS